MIGAERRAEAAKRGDDFVEDQQDVVLGADRGKALEVALGRNEHARRTRDRLDDAGGDGRGVVERDEAFEIVRQFRAVLRLAAREGVLRNVMRVAQMVDAGEQSAEHLSVAADAADAHAAEIDAVIAALAADQAHLGGVALGAMIGDRHLQCRLDRFRTGVGEEDVIEALGRDIDEAGCGFESLVVAHLEGAGIIERRGLL